MDKILSARVDESVLQRIGLLAQKLRTSKKNVIETAIKFYAQKLDADHDINVLEHTCGAWNRKVSAQQLVKEVKSKFHVSMRKHQK